MQPWPASLTERSDSAWCAKKRSAPSAWKPCRGRATAFPARKVQRRIARPSAERKNRQEKIKRLRLWLCSSCPLLRGSKTTRMHVPSQPLMRSPLSRFQTPTAPRRAVGFFRSGSPPSCPGFPDHPAYFGLAKVYFGPTLSAVDGSEIKREVKKCQCRISVQRVDKTVIIMCSAND